MAVKRRYSGTPDFYKRKLTKVMEGLGMKKEHYVLKYDPFEGARLDFTYKGVTRRLDRFVGNDLHYGSDALAQIALTMEKFLWMKKEQIFDLEVAAAGLPQLPAPPSDYFVGIATIEVLEARHKELSKKLYPARQNESGEEFKQMQVQYLERKAALNGG